LLRSEIAQCEAFIGNDENVEIEPIADAEPLPPRPEPQYYDTAATAKGDVAVDKLPQPPQPAQTNLSPAVALAKEIIADFVDKMNAKHGTPPQPPDLPLLCRATVGRALFREYEPPGLLEAPNPEKGKR